MTSRRYLIDVRGRRVPFSGRLLAVFVIVAGGTIAVLAGITPAQAVDGGPIDAADRDFLVKVRQAGLWEGPVGRQAQDHAESSRVKEVGVHLEHDHAALDAQVRAVAAQLGVPLPGTPSDEQQGWINELAGKSGHDYDVTFANRLRAAHGKVFAVIAGIRAGTRNEIIRAFATTANSVVLKHITILESTGFVAYNDLPLAPNPAIPPTDRLAGTFGNGPGRPVVWAVLLLALIAGITAAARILRPR